MPDGVDTNQLPQGEIGLRRLIAQVAGLEDDEVERHFLEVKSEIDLASKGGLAKVAKFILGAANRMPDRAGAAFGGHALMLLGVGPRGVTGVRPVEAKDLVDGVLPHLSAEGPRWDFHRVDVDGQQVLIIDVPPPKWGDPMFPCHREGAGLVGGTIYVRTDGASRPARGDEVVQLQNRTAQGGVALGDADLVVRLVGSVRVGTCRDELVEDYIRSVRDDLGEQAALEAIAAGRTDSSGWQQSTSLRLGTSAMSRRDPETFISDLDAWTTDVRASWTRILDETAAGTWPAIEVSMHNRGRAYLEAVQLVIDIPGPVRARDWWEEPDVDAVIPKYPRRYMEQRSLFGGSQSLAALYRPQSLSPTRPRVVRFTNLHDDGVRVTVDLGDVRPGQSHTTNERDFVLLADLGASELVTGTWTLTARGHNEMITGDLEVGVESPQDLTDSVRAALGL